MIMQNKDTQPIKGRFEGVNPSISDSSTYAFAKAQDMIDTFNGATDKYLYSRHSSPSNTALALSIAKLEQSEAAHVFASGMGAISTTLMQLCEQGDHILASRTIYGGTHALLKNIFPKWGIATSFVDIRDLSTIEKNITPKTKLIFCESLSNPLLEVADIKNISQLAKKYNLKLVVDNTFTPLIFQPLKLGADIVIHSLTKFINGTSDTVAGAVCASEEFINTIKDVNSGCAMLLGQTLDSIRAASILKNRQTLELRMKKHSYNAEYLAKGFGKYGIKTIYPGLTDHQDHQLFTKQKNRDFGYGGILALDLNTVDRAHLFMEKMQEAGLGYLAVSLGYFKTLFSASGSSTSSEIDEDEQRKMGLSKGLVRISIGLDHDIDSSLVKMIEIFKYVDQIHPEYNEAIYN
jgi:methionine-gamma-lyase